MFKKLVLKNFKCFSYFVLDLSKIKNSKKAKDFVLIYGENGIGKSSILDAFVLFKESAYSLIDFFSFSQSLANDFRYKDGRDYISDWMNSRLTSYRIGGLVRGLSRIGTNEETCVEYEGLLKRNGLPFKYVFAFENEKTTHEALWIGKEKVFSAKKDSEEQYFNEKYFLDSSFRNSIDGFSRMYYGHHSLLSCIMYTMTTVEEQFVKTALSNPLLSFIDLLERIEFPDARPDRFDYVEENSYTRSSKILPNIARGRYEDSYEERKNRTITLLNEFYCSLYKNIVGVDYDIRSSASGKKEYSLVFLEKVEKDEILRIPYNLESTGTQNLLALFTFLMASIADDKIILIDEIDAGINDLLLKNVVGSIQDNIKGQFIATTHNTLLLAYSIKNGCYLLNRKDNQEIESYSLDSFGRKIQAKTDVSGGYLKGNYGGVPSEAHLSIQKLVDILNE